MNEPNRYGIYLLDMYMLDYYGIKLFFQVCKTTENSVFLVELATKRYKDGIFRNSIGCSGLLFFKS